MALVALSSTLVILGSLFLDTMPDRGAQQRAVRKAVGEALAVQLAEMLRRDDPREIEKAMTPIVARTDGLRSVGVRRADGTLVLGTAAHAQGWQLGEQDQSRPEQITVPLSAQGQRWGRVEMAFAADDTHPLLAFFKEPLVQMLLFLGVAGWLVFGLYMRRALAAPRPGVGGARARAGRLRRHGRGRGRARFAQPRHAVEQGFPRAASATGRGADRQQPGGACRGCRCACPKMRRSTRGRAR